MDQRDFQALKTRIPGQVSEKVRETVEKLDRLWQTMGFSIDEKNERTDMITYHFNELAEKMLSEETEVKIKFFQKNSSTRTQKRSFMIKRKTRNLRKRPEVDVSEILDLVSFKSFSRKSLKPKRIHETCPTA